MAETHVISALVAKYRELSGRLESCEREAAAIREHMTHIEATIPLFKDGFDVSAIRSKQQYRRNPAVKKGDVARGAYDVLREAKEPLTSLEIVTRMMEAKGIEPSLAELQNARNSVGTCLKKKQAQGVVVSDGGHPKRWRLVG
jgi:hypothetical protein